MKSSGIYELYRQKAEELRAKNERGATPQATQTQWAPGSAEWLAENRRNKSS
jgi:hypothetical protein